MAQIVRKPYVEMLPFPRQGKVRDMHVIPGHEVRVPTGIVNPFQLMVATDTVSTHNVVHLSEIPNKGQVLTAMQIAWVLGPLKHIPSHLIAWGRKIYEYLPGSPADYPADLHLRAVVVSSAVVDPVEHIHRAYMAGSLWKFYREWLESGRQGPNNEYGLKLPDDLRLMTRFGTPLYTPTEKTETDPPLPSAETEASYPAQAALSREVYRIGREYALARGIEIVDFKGEIGHIAAMHGDRPCLVDEWLTGDCCRFTEAEDIAVGQEPRWLDKQIVRDEAEKLWAGGAKVPLRFSPFVISQAVLAYDGLFERLFETPLEEFQARYLEPEHPAY